MTEKLKTVSLFQNLADATLEKIGAIVQLESFPDATEVFEEGSTGDALYVILAGAAVVRKVIDPDEMRYKVLAKLPAGSFFGEMALFDGLPRSAGIQAQGGLELARIAREDFQQLLSTDPDAATQLTSAVISTLSARLRQTNDELVTVYETGKIIGDVQDLDEMVRKITDRIARVLKADGGLFLIYNEFSEEFDKTYYAGVDYETLNSATFDDSDPLTAWIKARRRSLVIPDTAQSPIEIRPGAPYSGGSLIATPLMHRNQFMGLMIFIRSAGKNGFTDDDENLCFAVATQSAAAIETAKRRREDQDRERLSRKFIGR